MVQEKKFKTTTGPVGLTSEKYSIIGSVVTEILSYRQSDIVLLFIIENNTEKRMTILFGFFSMFYFIILNVNFTRHWSC